MGWGRSPPRSAPTSRPSSTRGLALVGAPARRCSALPDPRRTRSCSCRGAAAVDRRRLRRGGQAGARAQRGGAGGHPCAGFVARRAPGSPRSRYAELLSNDLEPAALSLRPEIADALQALRAAGAAPAMVTGSGPTAVRALRRDRGRRRSRRAGRPVRRDRLRSRCAAGFKLHPGSTWRARGEAARGSQPPHRAGAGDRRGSRRLLLHQPRRPPRRPAGDPPRTSPARWGTGPTCSSGRSPSSRPAPSSASSFPGRRSCCSAARSRARARWTSTC